MDFNDFEPTRRLTTRAQAREALDATLEETGRFLRIFDDSGEFFGFDRRPVAGALRRLLRDSRDARVMIMLRDPGFVVRRCPLVMDLVRTFAPRMSLLSADASLREYSRGVIIADDAVVLRRPHFEQPVTYIDYDEKAIAAAAHLFEEMLSHAGDPVSGSTTGL